MWLHDILARLREGFGFAEVLARLREGSGKVLERLREGSGKARRAAQAARRSP